MNLFTQIFGEGKDLNTLQMSSRAVVMFIIALVQIRLAGLKTFGKTSAFDNIIVIMLGAILSRGVAGVSPFVPVVCAGLAMVLMTRFVSWLSIKNKGFERLVKGRPASLYKNGHVNKDEITQSLLTEGDLMEGVRKGANTNSLVNVEEVFLECSGELSVIKKEGGK